MIQKKLNSRLWLTGTALFAMAWVIARACGQALTIDESVSYSNFAALPFASHWAAHGNNHVLNSLVMRLFTSVFGPSPLTVRAGSVIGAAFYIYSVHRLSKLIGRDSVLKWAVFACLTFNPLVLDFMVAARGYGLAVAFLTCAIAIVAWTLGEDAAEPRQLFRACVLSSVCAALSFVANFSFAIVDAAAVLMLYVWVAAAGIRPAPAGKEGVKMRLRLLAACVVPGLLAAAYLAGSILLHWRDVQLVYGSMSLREMAQSLIEASLYEPSTYILTPGPLAFVRAIAPFIIPVVALFCAWRIAHIASSRGALGEPHTKWLLGLGSVVAGTMVLALIGHEFLFRVMKILLPKDRTAIYFVVLFTLLACVLAAIPLPSRAARWSRRGLTAMLFVLAGYYLCCLRIGYFKEWKFDSDVDKVYQVLAYYNHTCGLKDVSVNWRYDAGLNFYRQLSRRETFPDFANIRQYPNGRHAYVFYYPEDQDYIDTHGLVVAYQAPSGATVAINPAAQWEHPCEAPLPPIGIRWQ